MNIWKFLFFFFLVLVFLVYLAKSGYFFFVRLWILLWWWWWWWKYQRLKRFSRRCILMMVNWFFLDREIFQEIKLLKKNCRHFVWKKFSFLENFYSLKQNKKSFFSLIRLIEPKNIQNWIWTTKMKWKTNKWTTFQFKFSSYMKNFVGKEKLTFFVWVKSKQNKRNRKKKRNNGYSHSNYEKFLNIWNKRNTQFEFLHFYILCGSNKFFFVCFIFVCFCFLFCSMNKWSIWVCFFVFRFSFVWFSKKNFQNRKLNLNWIWISVFFLKQTNKQK